MLKQSRKLSGQHDGKGGLVVKRLELKEQKEVLLTGDLCDLNSPFWSTTTYNLKNIKKNFTILLECSKTLSILI